MRFLVTARIPVEEGNRLVKNPEMLAKMQDTLKTQKAETAYFMACEGQRTVMYVVDMKDASEIPSIVEPWWLMLKADVDASPVMVAEDLMKAMHGMPEIVKKYS